MREKSCKVDYEGLSDALTVSIGMVLPYLTEKEVPLLENLKHIQMLCYHANGSVRGMLAIKQEDVHGLSGRYDFLCGGSGEALKQFVLPQGPLATIMLHQVWNDAKMVCRGPSSCK